MIKKSGMKKIIKLIIFTIIVLSFSKGALAIEGKVIAVSGGDTIIVVVAGGEQRKIRLYGIDCPEYNQTFGAVAKDFTNSLVYNKNVQVRVVDKDQYGRLVGVVTVGKVSANERLLEQGLAWHYGKYCKESFCEEWKELETQAQINDLGLWAENSPTPPWQWRQDQQKETLVDMLSKIVGLLLKIVDFIKGLLA